jgi:pimeloyl-ACP methyl ester carboxylesterase
MKVTEEFEGQRTGERLFVLVHGWEHTAKNLDHLKCAVQAVFPSDDVLLPCYPASRWSNGDLRDVAEGCVGLIEGAWGKHQDGGYKQIILIGHSLGALIARKVYLIAHGQYSDYEQRTLFVAGKRAWAPCITRLVLLAGMNRGWKLWPKNAQTPLLRWLGRVLSLTLAQGLGLGRLVRAAHRGAPFVVNLRLDWLQLTSTGVEPDMVVQLAGLRDTVVDASDHVDLLSGRTFHYLPVDGTSHHALVQFDGTAAGQDRKQKFLMALQANGSLTGEAIPNAPQPDKTVKQVLLLMHGIRDYGKWTEDVRSEIEQHASVRAEIANYDYLPLLPFLLGVGRNRQVRLLMDRYAEARSMYPNAALSFLGHSNGTYVMASALRRYPACRFARVAFLGSILHRRFPWRREMQACVGQLRNYVATQDCVVAIFPSFFEAVRILPLNRDFGSAGHTGFTQVDNRFQNVAYLEGGHGTGLEPQHRAAILSFLMGEQPPVAPKTVETQSWRAVAARKACVLICLLLLGASVGVFWAAMYFNPWVFAGVPVLPLAAVLAYIFLFFQF